MANVFSSRWPDPTPSPNFTGKLSRALGTEKCKFCEWCPHAPESHCQPFLGSLVPLVPTPLLVWNKQRTSFPWGCTSLVSQETEISQCETNPVHQTDGSPTHITHPVLSVLGRTGELTSTRGVGGSFTPTHPLPHKARALF